MGTIGWICDGMDDPQRARLDSSSTWSVYMYANSKSCWLFSDDSGRLLWQNFGENSMTSNAAGVGQRLAALQTAVEADALADADAQADSNGEDENIDEPH